MHNSEIQVFLERTDSVDVEDYANELKRFLEGEFVGCDVIVRCVDLAPRMCVVSDDCYGEMATLVQELVSVFWDQQF